MTTGEWYAGPPSHHDRHAPRPSDAVAPSITVLLG